MSGTRLTEYVNGVPSTIPLYHPEFGYLCPSPRVCRSVAPVSGAIEMLIGAVAILSLLREEAAAASTHVPVPAEKSTKVVRARQHPRVPNEGGVNAFASAPTSVEWHQYQNIPRSDPHFNAATGRRTW
jgi:hypothetical protein